MNPSKKHKRVELIAQLVLILPLLGLLIYYAPNLNKWSLDAKTTYAYCIESGDLMDWHSATFMFEGRMLYCLLHDVIGLPMTAHTVLITTAIGMGLALIAALSVLLHWLMRRHTMFAVFALVTWIFILLFKGLIFMGFGLDFYHMCASVICTVALLYLKHPRKGIRVLAQAAFWLMLLHIPEFRKNAILTIPFYLFAWCSIMYRPWSTWRTAGMSVFLSCLVGLLLMCIPKIIPGVKITHPQFVMMSCDMRIAALCRGEGDQEIAHQRDRYKIRHSLGSTEDNWDVRANYVMLVREDSKPINDAIADFDWRSFKEDYCRAWYEHPASMLSARAIQSFNFFTQDYTPKWLQNWWNERWPALAEGRDAWSMTNSASSSTLLRNILMLILAAMLVYSVLRFWRHRFMSAPEKLALFLGAISWIYILSFLVVVPTSDKRYHVPSALLCLMSLFIFGIVLWREHQSRKQRLSLLEGG